MKKSLESHFYHFGKKANNFLDVIIVVLILIGAGIVSFIAVSVGNDINSELQADADLHPEAKAMSQTVTDNLPNMLDWGFLLMLVLLWAFLIVSTVFIDSHPVFFAIMVVLMLFAFTVTFMLSNVFYEIANDAQFITYKTDLPIIYFICTHLLETIIVIGGSTLISLYAKQRYST